jgi:hypothetical protein
MGAIGHANCLVALVRSQAVCDILMYVICTLLIVRSSHPSSKYVILSLACGCQSNYDFDILVLIDFSLHILFCLSDCM